MYWADILVLLPFTLLVYTEILRDSDAKRREIRTALDVAQFAIMFWGTFTEWLFLPVLLVLFCKRIVYKQNGNNPRTVLFATIRFWLPAALALGLYSFQLYHMDAFTKLSGAYYEWGSLKRAEGLSGFLRDVFFGNLMLAGGPLAPLTLWATPAIPLVGGIFCWRRRRSVARHDRARVKKVAQIVTVTVLLALPCLLHTAVVPQHTWTHDYASMKFFLVISLASFIFLPILAMVCLQQGATPLPSTRIGRVSWLLVAVAVVYTAVLDMLFPWNIVLFPREPDQDVVAQFIAEEARYEDIIFSNNVVTSPSFIRNARRSPIWHRHQFRIYPIDWFTRKRIYPALSCEDILWRLDGLSTDYNVAIFARRAEDIESSIELRALAELSKAVVRRQDMALYRIEKEDFLAYCTNGASHSSITQARVITPRDVGEETPLSRHTGASRLP